MINVYYVGQILPPNFIEGYPELSSKIQDLAANVFYSSLLKGFAENKVNVTCISQIPKEYISTINKYDEDNIEIIPKIYRKRTLIRFVNNIFVTFMQILKWNRKKSNSKYVVFDILRLGQSIGGLLACKIKGIKTIAIITDYPGHRMNSSFKVTDKLAKCMLKKYDYYVVLSEYMKEELGVDSNRCLVIEGIYEQPKEKKDKYRCRNDRFTILYAGSLHYKYGIMELVKAVQHINEDIILKIYGSGDAVQEIQRVSNLGLKISYGGVISHSNILEEERCADLLVNPRPTDENYVNYSFPSKNLEYMASGTPTLLTRIGSLPKEYEQYSIVVANNRSDELESKIRDVMGHWAQQDDYFVALGNNARKYILENKNARIQVAKILELVNR